MHLSGADDQRDLKVHYANAQFLLCTEETSLQAGLWQGPEFPSGEGFTSARKHLVITTTNCVNHRLELRVTDELLWEPCGCAREKSQNEYF